MTGISDMYRSARTAAHVATVWWLCLIDLLSAPLAVRLREQRWIRFAVADDGLQCPPPKFPDPRPTLAAMAGSRPLRLWGGAGHGGHSNVLPSHGPMLLRCLRPSAQWALLLPITSWGCSSAESFWAGLESTIAHLVWLILLADRRHTSIHVAHDLRDPLLDSPCTRERIKAAAKGLRVCFLPPLPPAYEGKPCWIWNRMAQSAAAGGADCFILLGDDVALEMRGWQAEVEDEFADVAHQRRLPLGAPCVALQDRRFSAFPTFPVVHRFHLDTFGVMFPPEFINQHGDPFLFEIYRRFGAAWLRQTAQHGHSLTD
jgi:hypothetical protein